MTSLKPKRLKRLTLVHPVIAAKNSFSLKISCRATPPNLKPPIRADGTSVATPAEVRLEWQSFFAAKLCGSVTKVEYIGKQARVRQYDNFDLLVRDSPTVDDLPSPANVFQHLWLQFVNGQIAMFILYPDQKGL